MIIYMPLISLFLSFLGILYGEGLKFIAGWFGIEVETPLLNLIRTLGVFNGTLNYLKGNWLLFVANTVLLTIAVVISYRITAEDSPIYKGDVIGQIRYSKSLELGYGLSGLFGVLPVMALSIGYGLNKWIGAAIAFAISLAIIIFLFLLMNKD